VTFPGKRGRQVRAVDGVSYCVHAGQTLAIVGESGSGKTVSCRAVLGLLPPSADITGTARFLGTQLIGLTDDQLRRHRGADVAMVFQDSARSLNPTMRIGAQIAEAVRAHRSASKAQARQQAVDLLRRIVEQAPAALPLQSVSVDGIHHTARLTSSSLILLMARVGLRFFGQASTQFMMLWQRNRRYGSSRLSSRSEVAWSRVSAMNR